MKFCTFGLSPADVHPGRFVFHKHRPKQAQRHASNLCQRCFGGGGSTDHIFGPKEKEDAAPSATYQAQKKQNKKETDE